jgi:hypothetical protein
MSVSQLTKIRAGPVAHGGTDEKIGPNTMDKRNRKPVVIPVRPVRPPSAIPAPLSMNAVTGEQPKRALIEILIASQQ